MEHVVYTEREEPLPPHIVHEVHSDVERVSRRVSIVELSEPCYYVIIMFILQPFLNNYLVIVQKVHVSKILQHESFLVFFLTCYDDNN